MLQGSRLQREVLEAAVALVTVAVEIGQKTLLRLGLRVWGSDSRV